MPIDLLHHMGCLPPSGGEDVGVRDSAGVAVTGEKVPAIMEPVIRKPVFRQKSAVCAVNTAQLVRRHATLTPDLLGKVMRKLHKAVGCVRLGNLVNPKASARNSHNGLVDVEDVIPIEVGEIQRTDLGTPQT